MICKWDRNFSSFLRVNFPFEESSQSPGQSSPSSPTDQVIHTMSSMMWLASRQAVVQSAKRQTAPRNSSSRQLSQSFLRSPRSLPQLMKNSMHSSRAYTTRSRGEQVAKDFKAWIDSLPDPKTKVRQFPPSTVALRSQTPDQGDHLPNTTILASNKA
jgi:hypothetical protein